MGARSTGSAQRDKSPGQEPDRRLVVDLKEIRSADDALVGGKAANLGELLCLGERVPGGFCLTVHAYALVQAQLPECVQLMEWLTDAESASELASYAARLRELFISAELPAQLDRELQTAYARLLGKVSEKPVAVRSSATAEDLPEASFAGQQETFLNVLGVQALRDAVQRCWASLWTDRAVSYRARNGIAHSEVQLAVVVQEMVPAEVAGVLFTANPVTGHRGQSVIDANRGLGESVVSGSVIPDHFVLDTTSGVVVTRELGEKASAVFPAAGGGTEVTQQREAGESACLTDAQIRAVAQAGTRVAEHYGVPQDLEWAIDHIGQIWLVQSRPITTLFPVPIDPKAAADTRLYYSVNVAQGLHRPLTPMGSSILSAMAAAAMRQLGVVEPKTGIATDDIPMMSWLDADGWMLFDITGVIRSRLGKRMFPQLMSLVDVRSIEVFGWLSTDPRFARPSRFSLGGVVRALSKAATHRKSVKAALQATGRVLASTKFPVSVVRTLLNPRRARGAVFAIERAIRSDLAARRALMVSKRDDMSAREHVLEAEKGMGIAPKHIIGMIAPLWTGLVLSKLLGSVLGKSVAPVDIQIALQGIPHNVTTDLDLELFAVAEHAPPELAELSVEQLTQRYREEALPNAVQRGLDVFFAQHGHRAAAEIDVGMPRWRETPEQILTMFGSYLRMAADGHSAQAQFQAGAREAETAVERVVSQLKLVSWVRARAARFVLERTRALVGLREMPKYCMVQGLSYAREQLVLAGQKMRDSGTLDNASDVFFLSVSELRQLLDGGWAGIDHRELITKRRAIYQREVRRQHVPRMLLSDGTDPEAAMPIAEDTGVGLTGTSASAGEATGTAKVILDPAGASLEPGEILVAPSTDPGWTPLFLAAGGLVMEMGGPNSHGATVAREYGIPAVIGVPQATSRIHTGQTVMVHGSAGRVSIQEEQ